VSGRKLKKVFAELLMGLQFASDESCREKFIVWDERWKKQLARSFERFEGVELMSFCLDSL
jgi:hypothetical protein